MVRKYNQRVPTGNRILIVDDSPEILESTRRLIENEGHQVFTASSGRAALEVLASTPIDLMIVDYYMPSMTGEELVREVRASGNSLIQIVLATGYSGEQPARIMMRQLDIQGYHEKSEGAQKLLVWVDVAINNRRNLLMLERKRQGLHRILELAPELHGARSVDELVETLLWQLNHLNRAEGPRAPNQTDASPIDRASPRRSSTNALVILLPADRSVELTVHGGIGRFSRGERVSCLPPDVRAAIECALESGDGHYAEAGAAIPLRVAQKAIGAIFLEVRGGFAEDREVLAALGSQASMAFQNVALGQVATTDPLTGAFLPAFADRQLQHFIKRGHRRGDPVSAMVVARVRDDASADYSGPRSEAALSAMGKLLRKTARDTDLVGCLASGEFLLILPDTPPAGAERLARRLLEVSTPRLKPLGGSDFTPLRIGFCTLICDSEIDDSEFHLDPDRLEGIASLLVSEASDAMRRSQGSGLPGEAPVLRWSRIRAN